jgi:hypothetical protein
MSTEPLLKPLPKPPLLASRIPARITGQRPWTGTPDETTPQAKAHIGANQVPIPSGRMPGRWGLFVALAWTLLSLAVAALLGPWVLGSARPAGRPPSRRCR